MAVTSEGEAGASPREYNSSTGEIIDPFKPGNAQNWHLEVSEIVTVFSLWARFRITV